MDLSIVIPTWNEARKIAKDVQEAAAFLKQQGLAGEIIVSDDGSSDETVSVARAAGERVSCEVRALEGSHDGKGAAVRRGMLEAKGRRIMFADSGSTVPYDNALRGIVLMDEGADVAMGNRFSDGRQYREERSWLRRVVSRLAIGTFRVVLGIPGWVTDTQCGFKLFDGRVGRELFSMQRSARFIFDVEILLLGLGMGIKIDQFPVDWRPDSDSRLRVGRALFHAGLEFRHVLSARSRAARWARQSM
jgi:dolichyl-phosphate beta-glucosyltransferase